MADILQMFQMHVFAWIYLKFEENLATFCSQWPNCQQDTIGSDHGLELNRVQGNDIRYAPIAADTKKNLMLSP